jgi:hypothetical protein
MTFPPTKEQRDAHEKFRTGESLVIEAGAGTGKTATLCLLAESTTRRGQYVAFNKAIVTEAGQKMPGHVACNTAHSLAFREVGRRYAHRLKGGRMRSSDIARVLGLHDMWLERQDGERKKLSASYLAGLTMRAVTRFCQSADLEPAEHHFPYVDGIDVPPGRMQNNRQVRRALMPAVRQAWEDVQRTDGQLPYRRIGAEFILFDEAQDANPVMQAIVAAQRHAQLVWVGDSQQQIYSFTGAVNALAAVPADSRAFLTRSFRFGPAIAEVANRVLELLDAELRITGTDTINSHVGPVNEPAAILTRTNAAAVQAVLFAQSEGKRVHLVGGGKEIVSFAKAARELQTGRGTVHPELACFTSWGEVQEYVQQDEQGAELRLMVTLVDTFGIDVILGALDSMCPEANADLIVSTAHKAKGREWDSVRLGPDFPAIAEGEELRLLYVAVTRARYLLDLTAVPFFGPAGPGATRSDPEAPGGPGAMEAPAALAAPAPESAPAGAPVPAPAGEGALDAPVQPGAASDGDGGGRLEVLVPRGNRAHRPLTQLARQLDWSRDRGEARLRDLDEQRMQLRAQADEVEMERLLLVSLLEPHKQSHYEEEEE